MKNSPSKAAVLLSLVTIMGLGVINFLFLTLPVMLGVPGGPLSFLDRQGLRSVVNELSSMAERFGPRYTPPKLLVEMAEKSERFFDAV